MENNMDWSEERKAELVSIIRTDNSEEMRRMINEEGLNPDLQHEGCYPLLRIAAECNSVRTMEVLFENGGNINIKNFCDERTPLHVTAFNGCIGAFDFLIEYGADIEARDKDGCIPLHDAAVNGHSGIVSKLIERGIGVFALDGDGKTALNLAEENQECNEKEDRDAESIGVPAIFGDYNETIRLLKQKMDQVLQQQASLQPRPNDDFTLLRERKPY
jgi:ankyrin repeat protein